jgi:hypothetical protein
VARPSRWIATALAVALAALAAGCGFGRAARSGEVVVTVTRDFGARQLLERTGSSSDETVMRVLQRQGRVGTRYGGRFVQGINGIESGSSQGRRRDWFYYVNGIEADVGAADKEVHGGDRVWWDYHDWSAAMRVPAVVGSFPEPFEHGAEGKRYPVRIDCAQDYGDVCRQVTDRLDRAGVAASITALGAPAGKEVLRLAVGSWADVRGDAAARKLEEGPAKSGVFAQPRVQGTSAEIDLLDPLGHLSARLGPGSGLVAATRFEEQQPTWVVTGVDRAGVARAVTLLDRRALRNRFAVAIGDAGRLALPVQSGGKGRQ